MLAFGIGFETTSLLAALVALLERLLLGSAFGALIALRRATSLAVILPCGLTVTFLLTLIPGEPFPAGCCSGFGFGLAAILFLLVRLLAYGFVQRRLHLG